MKRKINIFIFALVILAIYGISYMNIEIKLLESEIAEKKEEQIKLLEQKELYQEILEVQEELTKNLYYHIELLETKNINLENENENLKTIRAKLTAYSPLDNQDGQQAEGNPNKTSRGKQVGRKYAAADPKKIPYGTILEVPGYGTVEIQDTGGALRNDNKNIRVDLYHDTYKEAMTFGVQDKDIKILKWGE